MLHILAITGPIYIAIAIGYIAVRLGAFDKSEMRVLGKFVLNFALPAMLFTTLVSRPIAQIVQPAYILAYLFGALATIAITFIMVRGVANGSWSFAAVCALGTTCPNSGYVGFPIVLLAIGSSASIAVAQCFLVENLVLIPLLMALAERRDNVSSGVANAMLNVFKSMLRNPLVLAIVFGLICSLLGLRLPSAFEKVVTMFSGSSAGLSLFVIGGSLVGLSLGHVRKSVSAITAGKLLLHPILVAAVLMLMPLPLSNEMRAAVVLFAAMPMMGIYPIIAQKYGEQAMAAASVLAATVASFFTVTGLLLALKAVGWLQ